MTEVPWDKSEALDRISRACIDGDFDAARLGWLRLTEAGTNASYAKFAKNAIELRRLSAEREHDIEVRMEEIASMEHNLGLVISQAEVEQADTARLATRIALMDVALDDLVALVKALRARIRALEARG